MSGDFNCLACGSRFDPDGDFGSAFYCDQFCEDIGYQAFWYHFVEVPPA